MSELRDQAISHHGGLDLWKTVEELEVTYNFSGGLLALKGYPGHYRPTIVIDAHRPKAVLRNLFDDGTRGVFTPERVWVERPDGSVLTERSDPRGAFKGHVRETPWDRLHLVYFVGYALWNYLTTPFIFALPGFAVRELEPHREGLDAWRVLEVTYPTSIPTHTPVQKLYFDERGNLKRLDYVTDVLGGVAAHYCYDPNLFGGLVIPTFRRVVKRSPEGALVSGPTSFTLDYTDVVVRRN